MISCVLVGYNVKGTIFNTWILFMGQSEITMLKVKRISLNWCLLLHKYYLVNIYSKKRLENKNTYYYGIYSFTQSNEL